MKKYKKLGILASTLLLSFTMVACGSREEENSCVSGGMPPTSTVAPTAVPEDKEMPTPTPTSIATLNRMPKRKVEKVNSEAEQIPIDEKYFSDEAFRLFLGENYDTDKDGFLSKKEREQVTEMEGPGSYGSGKVVIDGLDWFPNVERLEMMGEAELHLDHHPGVVSVNWNEMGTSMLYVDGCDRLETIAVHMGGGAVVYVNDCGTLKQFFAWDGYLGSLYMSKVPELELCVDWYEELPKEIWLDDDAQILWRLWSDTEEPIRSDDMGVRFEVKEDGILYWDEVFDNRYELAVNWLGVKVRELDLQEQVNQMYAMYRESVKDGQSENDTTQAVIKTILFSPRKTSAYVVGEWTETGKLMTARYYIVTSDGTVTEYASLEEMRAAAERVAISEDNFGDARFCELLKTKFDSDENGYFSDWELAAVKNINFVTSVVQEPYTEVKGFSLFPELERIQLGSAQKTEICGARKLWDVSAPQPMVGTKYEVGELCITDCPKLESVDLWDAVFIGKSGNEVGELQITNCPVLQSVCVRGKQMEKVGIRIANAEVPRVSFYVGGYENETGPAYLVLDTNVEITANTKQNYYIPEFDVKTGRFVQPEQSRIEWTGVPAPFLEKELPEFKGLAETLQKGFFFEVQEVQPPLRDEEGRTGYLVHLDNKYLSDLNYHFYPNWQEEMELNEAYVHYRTGVLVFSKEVPDAEDFLLKWEEPLRIRPREYSPIFGTSGSFCEIYAGENEQDGLSAKVVYKSGELEEELGSLDVLLEFSVGPEGEFKFWTDLEEQEDDTYDYVTEGVWLEKGPEGNELSKEGDVPVTELYFTSILFRNFLKEVIDVDRNGILSAEEREAVTELDAMEYEMGPCVVNGLENFPNLKSLKLNRCGEVICQSCPKLETIYLDGCQTLVCRECPELQMIEIVGDGTADVETEGCPKLVRVDTNVIVEDCCEDE